MCQTVFSASLSTSLLVFSSIFLCVCVCVCFTENLTPPIPFWMKGSCERGEYSQPHGRAGAVSWAGAVWKVRGLASSGSQDSEGNSGRMGRLEPAGHQPTHPTSRVRFPRLSVSKHSMQNGMQNDSM